jgi:RNA polymerase sigma factor (sigma-70 family)
VRIVAFVQTSTLLRHLRRLPRPDAALTDQQLLGRFTAAGDEASFAELVGRHGALVLSVCRRTLRREQDAEDAFQAAFLVLARKAASIRTGTSLASWLYGVAWRSALRLRHDLAARRRHERRVAPPPADEGPDPSWREVEQALHEELARLPENYRAPLILCYLQGRTQCEAAQQLGWGEGVLRGRLDRGRARLRQRLRRRGITLSAALLASALLPPAPVSAALLQATTRLTRGSASASVAATAAAVCRGLLIARWKGTVLVLIVALAVTTFGYRLAAVGEPVEERPGQPAAEAPQSRADPADDPLPPGALARLGSAQLRHPHFTDWTFAPDHKTLLTTGEQGDLRSWDVTTGKLLATRKLPGGPHTGPTLSPDGKLPAGFTGQKFVIWDLASGKQLAELPTTSRARGYFWLSPDGRTLVAQPNWYSSHILLWDWKTGQQRAFDLPSTRPRGGISMDSSNHACFSPDGKLLATGVGHQCPLRLWDVATAQEVRRFDCDATISAFAPDGKYLAAASKVPATGQKRRTALHLWEIATGKEASRLTLDDGDETFYWCIAFSPDSKTIAWVSTEQVTLRDSRTGKERLRIPGRQRRVLFSPDGRMLAVQSANRLRLWDLTTGKERNPRPGHNGEADTIAWSPDGRLIATASWVEGILLWDAASGRQLPFPNPAGERWEIRKLAFTPDSRTLVSAHFDGTLKFWDIARAQKRRTVKLRDPEKPDQEWPEFKSFFCSADLKCLVTFDRAFGPGGKEISHLDLWELDTGKHLRRQTVPLGSSWAGVPDGRTVAFASGDTLLCLDAASGRARFTVPSAHGGPLAFTPDGKLLAGPVREAGALRVRFWEIATGREVRTLPTGPLNFLALADSRTALTTDNLGLHVWDLAGGRELHTYLIPEGCGEMYSGAFGQGLALSSDGRRAVTSLGDGTLLVWDLTLAQRAAQARVLAAADLAALWKDLGGDDTAKAYQALWRLLETPDQAVRFLGEHARPAAARAPEKVRRLIADLDNDNFAVREAAQHALADLGSTAEPALREALERPPSAEARRRLQGLVDRVARGVPGPETLRGLRAVQVLEALATEEAGRVLHTLAGGAASDPLTREAQAALERLTGRPR